MVSCARAYCETPGRFASEGGSHSSAQRRQGRRFRPFAGRRGAAMINYRATQCGSSSASWLQPESARWTPRATSSTSTRCATRLARDRAPVPGGSRCTSSSDTAIPSSRRRSTLSDDLRSAVERLPTPALLGGGGAHKPRLPGTKTALVCGLLCVFQGGSPRSVGVLQQASGVKPLACSRAQCPKCRDRQEF
jgi:hypothetical protein